MVRNPPLEWRRTSLLAFASMSKTVEHCPTCGAGLKMFWHTLNSGLVTTLIQCIQFVHANNRNEFHLQNDLHLTVNQFSNFTKLRFHALVAKVDGKPGYWLITKRGGQFLRGEIAVPLKVKTFRNKVLEHSHELIHINELKGKVPVFEREYAYETMRPAVEPTVGKQESLLA
jgi:hypothetical protein